MFIAMNRLKVVKGSEHDFEQVWFNRKSTLSEMPGFIVFHLVKGPEREDHVLYASHTVWRSRADFEVWTKSEQFRDVIKNSRATRSDACRHRSGMQARLTAHQRDVLVRHRLQ